MNYEFATIENKYYENFRTTRTTHRIEAVPANVHFWESLRLTLRLIVSNHSKQPGVHSYDLLHMSLDCAGDNGIFFFSQVGNNGVTVADCLHGDGLLRILGYFEQRIQSNKNIHFGVGTIVKIYTYAREDVDDPIVPQNL